MREESYLANILDRIEALPEEEKCLHEDDTECGNCIDCGERVESFEAELNDER